MWRFLFNPPFFRGLYLQFYISYSILNIHNYKNIQYYKKKISSDIPFNAFIVKWVFFFIFHLIVSVKYIEIMIFVCVFHTIFICDSSSVISSSVTFSSVPLSFIHGSVHYTENTKDIRTWKMPYGINNNIFHGVNKLQEKNTLAFSNWTLEIKNV